MKDRVKKSQNGIVFCHLQIVESSTLKSTLYRNKESKHHEYNRKNQESRIRKTPIMDTTVRAWDILTGFVTHQFSPTLHYINHIIDQNLYYRITRAYGSSRAVTSLWRYLSHWRFRLLGSRLVTFEDGSNSSHSSSRRCRDKPAVRPQPYNQWRFRRDSACLGPFNRRTDSRTWRSLRYNLASSHIRVHGRNSQEQQQQIAVRSERCSLSQTVAVSDTHWVLLFSTNDKSRSSNEGGATHGGAYGNGAHEDYDDGYNCT